MRYDPDRHHRRSIRLREYDYSLAGCFFITICTYRREPLFGDVVLGQMSLNGLGEIACEEWRRSGDFRPELILDAFVMMPNHMYGIVTIGDVGAHGNAPSNSMSLHRSPRSVATFIGGFKGAATRPINAARSTKGTLVWQRNYYEHIIRDANEFERIRSYIDDNPRRWDEDEYNPVR